ncbi:MAG: IS66 family insertion sequence element accessory protein TnpB [Oscillospiraceae bacterium]
MKRISEVKKEVRRKEWLAMVQACQNSGKPVKTWCRENGINMYTYYSRLKKLRTEVLEQAEQQSIVPVSIAEEMSTVSEAEKRESGTVVMRKNGLEVEIPESMASEKMLVLLRGMLEC